MEWSNYGQYNKMLRSIIRSECNQNSSIAIQNIQSFIQKMKNLQFSVSKLVEEFVKMQTQNHPKLDTSTQSNNRMNSKAPQKAMNLNLLKNSADNFDGFDGCIINDIDQREDIEMKQCDESKQKTTMSLIEKNTAKYYHDNYYGQNGMYYFS